MESDEIDILALSVFRDFEQIQDTKEARCQCQLRGNVRKTDLFDGIHFNLTLVHAISRTHFDVRMHPDSDATRYLSETNSVPEPFGKNHRASLHPHAVQAGICELDHYCDALDETSRRSSASC